MAKTIQKKLILNLRRLTSSRPSLPGDVTVGGTVLSPLRKRQSFEEALKDSIERNRSALKKLAHY